MNLNIITNTIKAFFVGIIHNLIPILFLLGLAFVVYAVFTVAITAGYIAVGLALILIALILAKESSQDNTKH